MERRTLEELVELGKKYTAEEFMIKRITFAEIVWFCCTPFLVSLPSLEYYKKQTGKKSLTEMDIQRVTVLKVIEAIAHFIGMTQKEADDVFMAFIELAERDATAEIKPDFRQYNLNTF